MMEAGLAGRPVALQLLLLLVVVVGL